MNIPWFFFAFGVVALLVVVAIWMLFGSSDWKEVSAHIIRSDVETISNGQQGLRITDAAFAYRVNIEFEYSVDGTTFKGDKVFAAMPNIFRSSQVAQDFVDENKPGSIVTAYYNPSAPQRSALIAGSKLPKSSLIMISFFVMFVFGVLVVALYQFNRFF